MLNRLRNERARSTCWTCRRTRRGVRESFAAGGWTAYLRELLSQDWVRLGTSRTRRASVLAEVGEKEEAIHLLSETAATGDWWQLVSLDVNEQHAQPIHLFQSPYLSDSGPPSRSQMSDSLPQIRKVNRRQDGYESWRV
jgi:hypothetical protein